MKTYPLNRVLTPEDGMVLCAELTQHFDLGLSDIFWVNSCIDHIKVSKSVKPSVMEKITGMFNPQCINEYNYGDYIKINNPKLIVQPKDTLNDEQEGQSDLLPATE